MRDQLVHYYLALGICAVLLLFAVIFLLNHKSIAFCLKNSISHSHTHGIMITFWRDYSWSVLWCLFSSIPIGLFGALWARESKLKAIKCFIDQQLWPNINRRTRHISYELSDRCFWEAKAKKNRSQGKNIN